MLPKLFDPPPFVAWRIEDEFEHASYRLVPHGVFRNVLYQCIAQWLALACVLITAVNHDIVSVASGGLIYFASLPAFVFLGAFFNVLILAMLNSPPESKVGALLNLCPREVREEYTKWLPSVKDTKWQWLRPVKITWCLLLYFLLPIKDTNAARLQALRLRREDSWLHAFSAFAAVTSFVSERQRQPIIPSVQTKFLLGYFSPIGFGFGLCLLTFVLYPAMSFLVPVAALASQSEATLPRFPFMVCVAVWFCQGSFYLLFDLKQDFAAVFHNYFDSRMFPKSMTRFARSQMATVPDIAVAMENHWIPWTIEFIMFGLAELYASFMHSLP
jgi:hypothetical protein